MTYRVLSLFAGIGGFDLGLERTGGFKTVAFCEIEPFAIRVLNKHWPEVPVYGDVRELTAARLGADGIIPNVIVGGFPCQDISLAGKGAGLAGERSGLWSEYSRLIGELRPRFVIVENVSALLSRGLGDVLGDLAALRYDAEWHCIPASAVGAPHRRDRIWIVAYPQYYRLPFRRGNEAFVPELLHPGRISSDVPQGSEQQAGQVLADTLDAGSSRARRNAQRPRSLQQSCDGGGEDAPQVANADAINAQGLVSWCNDTLIRREQIERQARLCSGAGEHQDWSVEPSVGRVAHGVSDRVGQLRAYGNAVVPQIPELIGRAILAADAERLAA